MGGENAVAAEDHDSLPASCAGLARRIQLSKRLQDWIARSSPAMTKGGHLSHAIMRVAANFLRRHNALSSRGHGAMTRRSGNADARGARRCDPARLQFRRRHPAAQSRRRPRRQGRPSSIRAATWTYGQLAERVDALRPRAARARRRGARSASCICLLDTIDWPTAFLGAIKAGVVAVPVNTLMTEDDYRFMLADSRARVLVVSEELYPKFAEPDRRVPRPRARRRLRRRTRTAIARFEDLIAGAQRRAVHRADHARRHVLLALHLGLDRQAQGRGARPRRSASSPTISMPAPILGLTENDVCYSVAKLFFAYGLGNAHDVPDVGRRDDDPDRRPADAGGVAALLRKHPVTVFYARADLLCRVPREPGRAAARRRRRCGCCISAGEALPPDVGRRWSERYGVDILDGLGSTEMLHIFLSNRPGDVKYGTTGKPVPGYDIAPRRRRRRGRSRHAARWASCRCAGRPARSCTGTTASSRARPSWANGRAPATSTSRTRTAISSIAAGATTCSRSAASMSRRSRSRARCRATPTCSKPPWSPGPTTTS